MGPKAFCFPSFDLKVLPIVFLRIVLVVVVIIAIVIFVFIFILFVIIVVFLTAGVVHILVVASPAEVSLLLFFNLVKLVEVKTAQEVLKICLTLRNI